MAQQSQQMSGQGSTLSEKDILQLTLINYKHMAEATNTYALESQNDNLRRDYLSVLGDIHSEGKQIFDLMQQKGYYNIKNASPQDITQVKSTFSGQSASM